MQVIPVIDIKNKLVVRGVAGKRNEYRPIQSKLVESSKPADVARALASMLGATTAYVADLDAIEKGKLNQRIYEQINKAGLRLILDAGIGDVGRAEIVLERCAEFAPDLVVGLESLVSLAELRELVRQIGREACLFSLDLMNGKPITKIDVWKSLTPRQIADEALNAGVRRLIVLDLADVGVGSGTSTLEFCRTFRDDHAEVELIAGGGVRGCEDLEHLADAGCSAALVASALHDGRLSREEIERAKGL